jgi:hypothetical protein
MRFLVDECGISLPLTLVDPGKIFRHPAFLNANSKDIANRLEAMKKYIVWPKAYTDGLKHLIECGVAEAIEFCFDNGADPNEGVYISERSMMSLLEWTFEVCPKRNLVEIIEIILRHGCDSRLVYMKSKGRRRCRWLESQYGMDWDEFAVRVNGGESLEVLERVDDRAGHGGSS